MLTISRKSWAALQGEYDHKRPLRFHAWWSAHEIVLGALDAFSLRAMPEQFSAEFAITGLREEHQLFLFCAARTQMPDMGDRQYLAVMDVLVGRQSDLDKLVEIENIARTMRADD